jgi:hypothetical protein
MIYEVSTYSAIWPKYPVKSWERKRIVCGTDLYMAVTGKWSPIIWEGNERKSKNFLEAGYCCLDCDEGYSLAEVISFLKEKRLFYVITTTKSHQKQKGEFPPRDRYRIVLKFSRKITSLDEYKDNMRALIKLFRADRAFDGARCFQPSTYHSSSAGEKVLVKPYTVKTYDPQNTYLKSRYQMFGKLPTRIERFLEYGELFSNGRNTTIYSAAKTLSTLGMCYNEIVSRIKNAPFSRRDFTDKEIEDAVKSACQG